MNAQSDLISFHLYCTCDWKWQNWSTCFSASKNRFAGKDADHNLIQLHENGASGDSI